LNIHDNRPLSGVVEAMCGSSFPASAEPMPTTRFFFWRDAGSATSTDADKMAMTIFFIEGSSG
jgi:hypothetical protein